jgi:UDP-2,3-diacylglucosamine pyrophosphatase LpxH
MRPVNGETPLFVQDSRAVDVTVISDTHLGTYDCHAKELLEYLNSIQPKILILNGDIIDFWAGKNGPGGRLVHWSSKDPRARHLRYNGVLRHQQS